METSALSQGIQFCDEFGYDAVPVRMIGLVNNENIEPKQKNESVFRMQDEISIIDICKDVSDGGYHHDERSETSQGEDRWEDEIVSEDNLEKIRLLLKQRETFETKNNTK